ncbi:MAG TPA: RNHCP domain-containing protein [Aliidongia sp.]|nr:RNHCP domain-containing protein [Aliidongia sp.]
MRKFQRKIEDFTCARCGHQVTGNGYTNHCPACLYSKHVDIAPGDRAAECGGLMRPIGSELRAGRYFVIHECTRCGLTRPNRIADDEMPALIRLTRALN